MLSMKQPFPGQYPDEKIILFTRRHWASFLGFMIVFFVMILIFISALFIFLALAPDVFFALSDFIILASSAYLLFLCIFFIIGWIDYYFDIMILTDHRLIDIHQRNLFNRSVDELELLHIEDVSADIKGYLPTFFNYGELTVETAGTARNFIFRNMPDPRALSRIIMQAYEKKLGAVEKTPHADLISQAEGLKPPTKPPNGQEVQINQPHKDYHIDQTPGEKSDHPDYSAQEQFQSNLPQQRSDIKKSTQDNQYHPEEELKEGEEINLSNNNDHEKV